VWTAITLQKFRGAPDHKQAFEHHNPVLDGIDAVTNLRSPGDDRATRLNASEHNKNDDDEQHKPEPAAAIVAGSIERPAAEPAEAAKQRYDKNDDEYRA
jgi:hypothetical protein